METLTIEIEVNQQQKIALAQLLKRISWHDARSNAVSDDEAQDMIDVVCMLQRSIRDQGIYVR